MTTGSEDVLKKLHSGSTISLLELFLVLAEISDHTGSLRLGVCEDCIELLE